MEIVKKYNAVVINSPWQEDFSECRNLALANAEGKWILTMDADEELDAASVELLKKIISSTNADAINVIIRNFQPEEDLVKYIDENQVRIFKNKPEYRYKYKVNEQIVPSIAEANGIFAESNIVINHYGYQNRTKDRAQRKLEILNKQAKKEPQDTHILIKMGETYKSLKEWDKAIDCFRKAIDNPGGNIGSEMKELIYQRLGQIALARDRYIDAENYAKACLRFNHQNAMAKLILGVALMYQNKREKAEKIFIELKATSDIHGIDLSDVDNLLEEVDPAETDIRH